MLSAPVAAAPAAMSATKDSFPRELQVVLSAVTLHANSKNARNVTRHSFYQPHKYVKHATTASLLTLQTDSVVALLVLWTSVLSAAFSVQTYVINASMGMSSID